MAPTPVMDTMVALLLAKTVMAAAAIGLFDALREKPLNVDEISARCSTKPAATAKLLRALIACKYAQASGDRYRLSSMARRWLPSTSPRSLHAAILHRNLDLRFMDFETYLRRGVAPGFHTGLTGEDWQLYHAGQASHAALIVKQIVARAILPKGATGLLDLGGAHGLYSFAFCNRYPRLHARVVDLSNPAGELNLPFLRNVPTDRVEFQQADFLNVELPHEGFDAVLIANVFHHFDEATNQNLICRAVSALRPGGVLIAVDAVRAPAIEESEQVESLLDLYFGAASGTGLWRLQDLRDWMRSAHLDLLSPVTLRFAPCCKMQVGRKPGA